MVAGSDDPEVHTPGPAVDAPADAPADDPADQLERELGVLLRRARTFSAQLTRDVHPLLEPGAYGLLVRLAASGGERTTDLAAALGVGKPTVSRQVAVLERLGLVERTPDSADARAQTLRLTPDGAARVESARAARREVFRSLLARWPDDDVAALADLLHRFNALVDD